MKTTSPKVSIVLPTYNGANYLKQSIDSCLRQTYTNIELIIVDDGSTDETALIIKSYNDGRIKYIRHKKNAGLPSALNTGFAHTKGEYLTWTSNDNEYLPTAIEEMISFLEENRDVDFVYADYWAHYLETNERELRRLPDCPNLAKKNEIGACFLYTRRVYEEIGNYNPKYQLVEDYDYWIRICQRFNAKHYPRPLYIYGEHSKSLKTTKHIGIVLFENVLKYKNNFISLTEFSRAFLNSFWEGNDISLRRRLFLFLQNTSKISLLSVQLSILCLILLVRSLISAMLKFVIRTFFLYPLKYLNFLSFKLKSHNLKRLGGRKNVLCIVPYLVIGGAERVILSIAKGTDNEKFNFHLITTSQADNVWRNKFDSHFLNIIDPKDKFSNTYSSDKIYYKYFQFIIKKLEIDIVLTSNSLVGYNCICRLKSEFKNLKIVDVVHAEESTLIDLLVQLTPYVDERICISQHLKNYLAERYRKSKSNVTYLERLIVIYNGIDVKEFLKTPKTQGNFKKRFSIPNEAKIISFIGRFAYEKNPSLFVEIAKAVIKLAPNEFRFVMAGDGPYSGNISEKIKDYGLEKYFILPGMIDNVAELLNDSYILLISSRAEGIPLTILEAMAAGVPVISTYVGGISEVVEDNVNGFLIDPKSDVVNSFVNKIFGLLKGEANYSEISEKARQKIISRFTVETMGEEYEKVLEKLTEDFDK